MTTTTTTTCPASPLASPLPLRFPLEPTLGGDDDDNKQASQPEPIAAGPAVDGADTSSTAANAANQGPVLATLPTEQQQQEGSAHQQEQTLVPAKRPVKSRRAWDARLKKLALFQQQFGHLHVPKDQQHASLWHWVAQQRYLWRKTVAGEKGGLSQNRIAKLVEMDMGTSQGPAPIKDMHAAAMMKKQAPPSPAPLDAFDNGSSKATTNQSTSQEQEQQHLQPSIGAPQNVAAAAAAYSLCRTSRTRLADDRAASQQRQSPNVHEYAAAEI
jgi:hypothetical protein